MQLIELWACEVVTVAIDHRSHMSYGSKTVRTYHPLYSSSKRNISSWSSRFFPLYHFLPHSSILYIILYPLWGPLVTLSKYIHVRSSFEAFTETNLMVQSEFNLVFLFVSYNIFLVYWINGAHWLHVLSPLSHAVRSPRSFSGRLEERWKYRMAGRTVR
jgi:hypothetical protein